MGFVVIVVCFVLYKYWQSKQPIPEVEGAKTVDINSLAEWTALLKEAQEKKVPVAMDFYATWCPPCRVAAPKYAQMSKDFDENTVLFGKCNVDVARDVARQCKITSMPTFKVFFGGEELSSITGWNRPTLVA